MADETYKTVLTLKTTGSQGFSSETVHTWEGMSYDGMHSNQKTIYGALVPALLAQGDPAKS